MEIQATARETGGMGTLPPPDPDLKIVPQTIRLTRVLWKRLKDMAEEETTDERRFSRNSLVEYLLELAVQRWEEARKQPPRAVEHKPVSHLPGTHRTTGDNGHTVAKRATRK